MRLNTPHFSRLTSLLRIMFRLSAILHVRVCPYCTISNECAHSCQYCFNTSMRVTGNDFDAKYILENKNKTFSHPVSYRRLFISTDCEYMLTCEHWRKESMRNLSMRPQPIDDVRPEDRPYSHYRNITCHQLTRKVVASTAQ